MEARASRHKRFNSDPVKSKEEKNMRNDPNLNIMGELEESVKLQPKRRQTPKTEVEEALKQEILELQDRLHEQFVVRCTLEKALSNRTTDHKFVIDKSIPTPAKELIKEIEVLELEVAYLEQYLLSMYRKTCDQSVPSQSTTCRSSKGNPIRNLVMPSGNPRQEIILYEENPGSHSSDLTFPQDTTKELLKEWNGQPEQEELFDYGMYQCRSSISQHSFSSTPRLKSITGAVDSYHSLPLSMMEQAQNDISDVISLGNHLASHDYGGLLETPNRLSEETIKCISAICLELADPPFTNLDYPFSPVSLSSRENDSPSAGQDDMWSSPHGNASSFNSSLKNPDHIGDCMVTGGPYSAMAKLLDISRDPQKLRNIQHKLRTFRSLVSKLEEVDPRTMKHEEKLAFWINIHNALVLHAFFIYGIPRNNIKRMSLILKAAYNVGGQNISVEMIQSSILGCRLPRPGHWLRLLFSSKIKSKVGDKRQVYAIHHPEPRSYFALCSGCHSDPAVRVYTPKRVFEDLETAKEEYIQSTFVLQKEKKLLPKIVESFARDLDVCPAGLLEMIKHLLPDSARKSIQSGEHRKFSKGIEWIPHNFTFRYLFSKELALGNYPSSLEGIRSF